MHYLYWGQKRGASEFELKALPCREADAMILTYDGL